MAYSPQSGLRIVEAPPGGPAARAGLRPGDRILAIDGRPTAEMTGAEVTRALRGEVGTPIQLQIQRGEETFEVDMERAPYEDEHAP